MQSAARAPGWLTSRRHRRRSGRGLLCGLVALAVLADCVADTDDTDDSGVGQGGTLDSASILTDAQMEKLRFDSLTRTAQEMSLAHPPDVALVRWVDLTDLAPTRVGCLAELGFAATAVDGAGIEYAKVPPSQADALKAAIYTCEAKYSLHPYYQLPNLTAALSKLYDWYVNVSVPCLEAAGYDVSEPPSKDAWLAVASSGGAYWAPYADIPITATGPAERAELERSCPQGPEPGEWLEHVPVLRQ